VGKYKGDYIGKTVNPYKKDRADKMAETVVKRIEEL
jgi:hypothetical protein